MKHLLNLKYFYRTLLVLLVVAFSVMSYTPDAKAGESCFENYKVKKDLYFVKCDGSLMGTAKYILDNWLKLPSDWMEFAPICESYKPYFDAYWVLKEAMVAPEKLEDQEKLISFYQELVKGAPNSVSYSKFAAQLKQALQAEFSPLCPEGFNGENLLSLEEIKNLFQQGEFEDQLENGFYTPVASSCAYTL